MADIGEKFRIIKPESDLHLKKYIKRLPKEMDDWCIDNGIQYELDAEFVMHVDGSHGISITWTIPDDRQAVYCKLRWG
jgi:hypothetical protein